MNLSSHCEPNSIVNLEPTIGLHRQLASIWRGDPTGFAAARENAVERLYQRGVRFEQGRRLQMELSALLLPRDSIEFLRDVTERIFGLVERVLDWVVESRSRLAEYFPEHRRLFAHFTKCPGLDTWQGYSRYDAIITKEGEVKIIELNTGCPAGLFGNGTVAAKESLAAIREVMFCESPRNWELATIPPELLVNSLLEIETAAGITPGLIAVLYDENRLDNQLDDLVHAMRDKGRESESFSASDLTFDNNRVCASNKPVSLTFNKFRISTAQSPNHCWKDGFADRYQGLLKGMKTQAFASVNSLVAMSIAEDKSLLGLFFLPEIRSLFSDEEQQFIDRHILWTAPLQEQPIIREGELVDCVDWSRRHRHDLVVKPANEGRGFGVTVGRFADDQQWWSACQPNGILPCVVQEYAQPLTLPVVSHSRGTAVLSDMFVTLGLGVIRGKYQGMMSRISQSPVTNVARSGMVQAVFQIE